VRECDVVVPRSVHARCEQQRESGEEHRNRADHAADRRNQRIDRLCGRVQLAAGKARLGDLCGGDAEEEHHEDVVDQVVQIEHVAEQRPIAERAPVHDALIAVGIEVRGEQRRGDPREQRDRELLEHVEEPAPRGGHGCGPVSGSRLNSFIAAYTPANSAASSARAARAM
jgi:hypothetical protein